MCLLCPQENQLLPNVWSPFLVHFRGQNPESLGTGLSNQMEANPFREEGDSGGTGTGTWVCAPQAWDPSAANDLSSGVWDGGGRSAFSREHSFVQQPLIYFKSQLMLSFYKSFSRVLSTGT